MTMIFTPVNDLRNATERKKARAAFFTPMTLVEKLVEWAAVYSGHRCLEPSAGDGRIAFVLRRAGVVAVDCCEIDDVMHPVIKTHGGTVVGTDFLAYTPGPVYDRIIMNPPFKGKTVDRHTEHAWTLLAPGGVLIGVVPDILCDRLTRTELRLGGCEWATAEKLGPNLFSEYGTAVSVGVVELCKNPTPDSRGDFDGFSNRATWNAALTIKNDYSLYKQWVTTADVKLTRQLIDAAGKVVGESGGSVYGVRWTEVWHSVRTCK